MKMIIDAEYFKGFIVKEHPNVRFAAAFIEVEQGIFKFKTSWNTEIFYEGDSFIYLDIAACVSNSNRTNTEICSSFIDGIVIRVLHELSHWAGGSHTEADPEAVYRWNLFLKSLHLEGSVNE